jgi:hypothetical protein
MWEEGKYFIKGVRMTTTCPSVDLHLLAKYYFSSAQILLISENIS